MSFELPPDPRTERRTRITQWVSFGFAALLVVLIVYLGYVAYEGSRQLTDAPDSSGDCRTPAAFGWAYEAINYSIETDAALQAEADPMNCAAQGARAGDELTAADGTRLAGWYIPSASDSGPTGPTVVMVHGWGSNKSAMLDRAAILHETYNLLIVDLRNHGQSEDAPTTQGVREAADVEAAVDWLESAKAPELIAMHGVSMGGVTALNAADDDERIDAVILESTHATIANASQARLEQAGYPLSLTGQLGDPARSARPHGRGRQQRGRGPGDRAAGRAAGADRLGRPGPDDRRERSGGPVGRRGRSGIAGRDPHMRGGRPRRRPRDVPGGISGLGARLPRACAGTRQLTPSPPTRPIAPPTSSAGRATPRGSRP